MEVTPRSRMPHGTMWPNMVRSGDTFSANPCRVRPRATRTPIAAILAAAPSGWPPSSPSSWSTQTPV